MHPSDRNLLFGVIAMQCGLLEGDRFTDAATLWTNREHISLGDVLVAEGWMSETDRRYVDELVERRLARAMGNAVGRAARHHPLSSLDSDISMVGTVAMDFDGTPDPSSDSDSDDQARTVVKPEEPSKADRVVTISDRISLDGLHSWGGIGEVWKAYDHVLERTIALKRLRRDKAGHRAHRDRFHREARLTGQLDHPGIVPVYDFGTDDDGVQSYYTMRFLRGRTLTEVIHGFHSQRKQAGESLLGGQFLDLIRYFSSVCDTITFAHSRGVIHRDLKGDNVIIGDFGEVIVLDWGLAKRMAAENHGADETLAGMSSRASSQSEWSGSQTLQGDTLGTPSYMAPEQAQGRLDLIDYRTDVYGLAAMLYEILTGRPPFCGDDMKALIREVIEEPPTPPGDLVAGVPPALERACLQGLSKSRRDRQESVNELAEQVRAWQTDRLERKRVEEERERFFDLSLDLLAIAERPDRLSQVNDAWHRQLGWTVDRCRGASLLEFVETDHRDEVRHILATIWSGQPHAAFEARLRAHDGTRRWIHWSARKMPGQEAIYLVGRDITARKRREREYQGLLESAPDPTCVVDSQGTIVRVNKQLEKLFGYNRDELLGQPVEMLIPRAQRDQHQDHVARYIAKPGFRPMGVGLQLSGEKRDGSVFPLEISLGPTETDNGLLISCALRDTSARHGRERTLQSVFDAMDQAIWVVDRALCTIVVNHRALQVFGYTAAELVGKPAHQLLAQDSRDPYAAHIAACLKHRSSSRVPDRSLRLQGVRKNGESVRISLTSFLVSHDQDPLVCSTVHLEPEVPRS